MQHKRVLSMLSYVAKSALHDRRLDEFGENMMGGDYGDMMGDYGDMMGGNLLPDEVLEEFSQCGVDLEAIMDEVLLGGMMGGGDPEGSENDDILSTMMGSFGSPTDMLVSLADEGEVECTTEEEEAFAAAIESFNSCTGEPTGAFQVVAFVDEFPFLTIESCFNILSTRL